MILLRKAKLNYVDFEIFKRLSQDEENFYQFLYICENWSSCVTEYNFIDEIISDYKNYSFEQFKQDINSKDSFIYIIEDDSKIIGYLSMFYCSAGNYKIAEWAMINPKNDEKIVEVLNYLKKLKLPRLKKFSICTINNAAAEILLSNGFHPSEASYFYTIDIV